VGRTGVGRLSSLAATGGSTTDGGGTAFGSTQARAGRCSCRPLGTFPLTGSGRGSGSIRARAGLRGGGDCGEGGRTTVGGPSAGSSAGPLSRGSTSPTSSSKVDRRGRTTCSAPETSGGTAAARRGRKGGSSVRTLADGSGSGCTSGSGSGSGETGSAARRGPLERRGMCRTTGSEVSGSSRSARRGRVTATVCQAFDRSAQGSDAFVPESTRSLPAKRFPGRSSGCIVEICPLRNTSERTPSTCKPCTARATTE
jgi:hypothetical protein